MSAIAPAGSQIRPLDAPTRPDQQVTAADVSDPSVLARLLMNALSDVAKLKRRWFPNFIDFRDVVVDATGTTKINLPHRFKAGVNYWPVKWVGAAPPNLRYDASSDVNTLILTSTSAGVVTIRVEVAG